MRGPGALRAIAFLAIALWLVPAWAKPRKSSRPAETDDEVVFEPDERRAERGAPASPRPPSGQAADDDSAENSDPDEGASAAGAPSADTAVALTGEPPPGYERFEILDKTIGFRDDTFAGIEVTKDGVLWVGSYEGRAYASTDDGETWVESTVLPEVKSLYGFRDQTVLLGSLRSSSPVYPSGADLSYGLGGIGAWRRSNHQLDMRLGDARAYADRDAQGFSMTGAPSLLPSGAFWNHLEGETRGVLGAGQQVLGAGYSARAPRLSRLLNLRGRPIAAMNLQRFLYTNAGRTPVINRIVRHPVDKKSVFAATQFGLYQSIDGGTSWFRSFPGLTSAERYIYDVVVDPRDPNRVYMGTSRGLFQSDDAGMSWQKNTRVPEIRVKKIAVDPSDNNYIYAAGAGGVYRSGDRGKNFEFAYYHSLPRRRDVFWIVIDPFDPNTAYLGTGDGLIRTGKLRTSTSQDWDVVNPLRTVNLVVSTVDVCTKHPGHIYMMTRADLPTVNYAANGPESLMLESWDHGETWIELAANRTAGDIRWFTLDPNDTDTVWVAFSRAIVKIQRTDAARPSKRLMRLSAERLVLARPVLPADPSLSQVVLAALEHTGASVETMTKGLDRLRNRRWLPDRINVGLRRGSWNVGTSVQNIQFPPDKILQNDRNVEWLAMAWATWALPDIAYRQDSAVMLENRVLQMAERVRQRVVITVHRNYSELQRLRVRQAHGGKRDLYKRVLDRVRIEYLESVVDLVSGGFLTRWKQKAEKS